MRINASKKDIETFNKSDIGKVKNSYLKRAKITGILCIIMGICWLIISIYLKLQIYDYILSSTLIIFGIYFLINSNRIKLKEVNKYIYETKKSSKK